MTAALLRSWGVTARAAGITDWGNGMPPGENVLKVIEELGAKPEPYAAHLVTREEVDWADLILVFEQQQYDYLEQTFQVSYKVERLGDADIPNPSHLDPGALREVGMMLKEHLTTRGASWLESVLRAAGASSGVT